MPQIIVRAQTADGAAVTLAEDAVAADQQDDQYIAQLIERVGWALIVAERLEWRASRSQRDGRRLCGGCFAGCPYGSKNSLDHNYLI